MKKCCFLLFFLTNTLLIYGQLSGRVIGGETPIEGANVYLPEYSLGSITNKNGFFSFDAVTQGDFTLVISYVGYLPEKRSYRVENDSLDLGEIFLMPDNSLKEVVISGSLKPVNLLESTIPVEVYSPAFLKKNPSPSLFEGIQFINGVRPKINCSVCNTGDIHINGLEGPYTFILIDGMPIISSLASVYGLNGIPNAMIEQVEIVKGPSGTLYGSQAIGGLINVITKLPEYSPLFFSEIYGTSWAEFNADFGFSGKLSEEVSYLSGINLYHYDQPFDQNGDNFTDVTLQKRFSLFQKFSWNNKPLTKGSLAIRYLYEDRWGGELQWTPTYRGSEQVYGESIYTSRYEIIGMQKLSNQWEIQYSFTSHDQNSFYGNTDFQALEKIGFLQNVWRKQTQNHKWVAGVSTRYTHYDDNTPATQKEKITLASKYWIPSLFVEDEIQLNKKHQLLLGARLDHHSEHKVIFTPRVGYKITLDPRSLIRFNFGTGFRVVNIFTEDHAALTGARELVIEEDINPESSLSLNLNFYKKWYTPQGWIVGLETNAWHTRFLNQILPDFDSNPNQIRYANLEGYGISKGFSLNLEASYGGFQAFLGSSLMDVFTQENNLKTQPVFTEKWSATWAITAPLWNNNWLIDYTGNLYGPMRLPLLGDFDPRAEYSPVWSIQNIKLSYRENTQWTFFIGMKNLLNWTPAKNNPFLIARSQDPFDQNVNFNSAGNIMQTEKNPYGLSFDPTYIYAPNQGIRMFIGLNFMLN